MATALHVLERRLCHAVGTAVARFRMIQAGDRVAVALSGGKDSYVLLHALASLRARSPVAWELGAVTVDPGDPTFPVEQIVAVAERYGCACAVERTTIFQDVLKTRGGAQDFCSLCSRFRRGALLRVAQRIGANRLALGHHREDLLETLLLNLCFSGRFMAMAPVLPSRGGAVIVTRPLVLVPGELARAVADRLNFPAHTCGRGDDTRRRWARELLAELEAANPRVRASLLRSLEHVVPTHLLGGAAPAYDPQGGNESQSRESSVRSRPQRAAGSGNEPPL